MKKKQIKAVIRTVVVAMVAAVVGLNLYLINAAKLGGDTVPMPFGVGAAVVLSGSMEPELSIGDLLIISERESYEIDDVVVYQDSGMAITHRIVFIADNEIITRGDANNTDDSPISREQIKGEVVLAIPFVGYAVNAIKTPIGTFGLLAGSVFLLERSFHAEKKKDKKELEAIKAEIEKIKQEQSNK